MVARHRAGVVRVGKGAGGGVAVRPLEGGGVDVVVEVVLWWHQVGGVERLPVVAVGMMLEPGLVAQGGGRRGGAGLLVPEQAWFAKCSQRFWNKPATGKVQQIRVLVRVGGVIACSENVKSSTQVLEQITTRGKW